MAGGGYAAFGGAAAFALPFPGDLVEAHGEGLFAQTNAIIRRYGSNYFRRLFDGNDFLGYGVQPGRIEANASWDDTFDTMFATVSLGSYSGAAITDTTDIALIDDLGGLPWVAVAYGDTSRNAANLTASYNHSSNLPAGQLVLSASLSALGFWEIA